MNTLSNLPIDNVPQYLNDKEKLNYSVKKLNSLFIQYLVHAMTQTAGFEEESLKNGVAFDFWRENFDKVLSEILAEKYDVGLKKALESVPIVKPKDSQLPRLPIKARLPCKSR